MATDSNEGQTWRVQREIPLSLIVFLVAQMVVSLVSLGAVIHELNDFTKIKDDLYTRSDAAKEREIVEMIIAAHGARNLECERRLGNIEDRIEKHVERDRLDDMRRSR